MRCISRMIRSSGCDVDGSSRPRRESLNVKNILRSMILSHLSTSHVHQSLVRYSLSSSNSMSWRSLSSFSSLIYRSLSSVLDVISYHYLIISAIKTTCPACKSLTPQSCKENAHQCEVSS